MKNRIILITLCWLALLCRGVAVGQTVQHALYSVDGGLYHQLTEVTSFENFDVNISSLKPGFHTLTTLVVDSEGRQSTPVSHYFALIASEEGITDPVPRTCQYWIDRDYSTAKTTSVTNSMATFDVDITSLLPGFHTLTAMVVDGSGRQTTPVTHYFALFTSEEGITDPVPRTCQYWIDRDYSTAKTTSVTNSMATFDVDITSLLPGFHTLTAMVVDGSGRQTVPVTHYFALIASEEGVTDPVPRTCQYWIDRDYSTVKTTGVTNSMADFDVDITSLLPGFHTLTAMVVDGSGRQTTPVTHYFAVFNKEEWPDAVGNTCQYWIDADVEHAMTTTLTDAALDIFIDIDNLRPGTHSITCVALDDVGRWSVPVTHFFAVIDSNALRDALLVGYEYWFNSAPRIHVDVTPSQLFDMDNIIVPIENVIPNKIENYRFDISSLTAFVPDDVLFGFHVIDDAGNLSAACTDTIAMEVPVPITFTLLKHRQPETDSVPAKCAFNGYRCENLREGSVVTLTVTGDAKMTIDIYGNDGNRLECQPVTEDGVTVWRVSPPAGNLYFVAYDAKGEAAEVEVEVSIDVHGDVNMDGEVGVADVTSLVAILLYGTDNEEMRLRADVNLDGEVGVADLTALVAIVMGTK